MAMGPPFGFWCHLTNQHQHLGPLDTGPTPPRNAILIGRSNPFVARLIQSGEFRPELRPGHGRIKAISQAPGGNSVVVIAGADSAGERHLRQGHGEAALGEVVAASYESPFNRLG